MDKTRGTHLGTLGAHIDTGYTITAYCNNAECRHSAKLNLVEIAKKLGREHSTMHDALTPKLVCMACGGKSISIRMGNPPNLGIHR